MTEEKKQSETVEGGKYIQGENYINANGDVIGKVNEEKAEPKTDTAPKGKS